METLDHLHQSKVQAAAPPPAKCASAKTKKRRSNPTWLKRKHELQALREQVTAMETHVLFLQMKICSSNGATMNESLARTGALVEKKRRRDAQEENERLRTNLKTYARQAKTLLAAAEERQEVQLIRGTVPATTTLHVEVGMGQRLRLSYPDVLDLLRTRVDARFREVEESFALMKQPMASTDTNVVETVQAGAVDFARIQLLPFRNDEMSSALWSIVEVGDFPDGKDSIVTRLSRDAYAVSSHVTVHLECGGTISVNSARLLKRFDTPNGVVILAESNSDWTADHPGTGSWRHTTYEGGCFSIRDYPVEYGASAGICQTRSMLRLTPVDFTGQSASCAAPQTVNEVVIPSFRELVNSRHQFVENALFDMIRS
ncbi:hypothetical protein PR003_g28181 [Phytophthora rubi]|uniref:Uncharacterized protein n=1 Tax=Phytophthora rubi TaxID=129364 RepID=A0A6A4BXI9_9STRA|nr:hypothetical protein PR002_g27027 [Phytophthora rubi]KAE9279638.1 hypothetical protein PR003_g28181 [Phytophthora rubi]